MSDNAPSAVIILAAGEGTRMRSATVKVLHSISGRPLVGHVVAAAAATSADEVVVVCGHKREQVQDYLSRDWPDVVTTVQEERHGTGHAVRVTLEQLAERGITLSGGPVVVVSGDSPLLTTDTLVALSRFHGEAGASVTVLSANLADPTGYGRLVRGPAGEVLANVEQRDADEETLRITEVNSGMYAFDANFLAGAVDQLSSNNSQGEEYLPDLIGMAREGGRVVAAMTAENPVEILGVNNRAQLADCGTVMRARINRAWMAAGVTMTDPDTTYIDATVELESDVTLEPGVLLRGATEIATGAVIGPDSTLIDTEVAAGAHVNRSHLELAVVGPGATVGPFTYLRPGAVLAERAKAGAYVEIKNSKVGPDSKVPHLSYVGDATIGRGSNIGASTIFVNYDGVSKSQTSVGDEVRIGSDTMLVAPVNVGDGAYTAAGSVITQDVPPGAMGIGRGRQRNVEGWVEKNRSGTASAAAAVGAKVTGEADESEGS
jgi:bifunctional UDP-N-acetylglucosamine pyrophosphorylase/glucosamine-1-phosphate N-acetyltransferase